MKLVPLSRARSAILVLYELLKEREPWQSISHQGMPTMEEHAAFVRSQPYLAWYLIEVEEDYVGTIYLTKAREVGVFVFRKHWGQGYGKQAVLLLKEKWPGRMLANVNPKNEASRALFEDLGMSLIQVTYAST